jgi:CDP-glucose 4,6-dehydratase
MLAEPSARWCSGWNFGPAAGDDVTVRELAESFIEAWGCGSWEDVHDPRAPIETHALRLAIDKATAQLPWRPKLNPHEAIRRTATWFRKFTVGSAIARSLCDADIESHDCSDGPSKALSTSR